jgi:hypothetical protein
LESGLFNGLRPIQIKNFLSAQGRSKCLTLSFGHTGRGYDVATGKGIARSSVIRKWFVRKSAFRPLSTPSIGSTRPPACRRRQPPELGEILASSAWIASQTAVVKNDGGHSAGRRERADSGPSKFGMQWQECANSSHWGMKSRTNSGAVGPDSVAMAAAPYRRLVIARLSIAGAASWPATPQPRSSARAHALAASLGDQLPTLAIAQLA